MNIKFVQHSFTQDMNWNPCHYQSFCYCSYL